MTNDYGNLELHKVLLSAMKDIDKICRENNLKYYLHAGTLLGAINHKGFIPWDDDVDLSMPQKDYEKFYDIITKDYKDLYFIETYDNTPNHYSKLNKLRILNAYLVYENGEKDGVFIDISIFHNVPKSKFSQKIQQAQLMFWDTIISIKAKRIILQSYKSKIFLYPFSLFSKKTIGKIYDSIMTRFDKKETDDYALMIHMNPNPYTGVDGYNNDRIPKAICENPQYIPFEDTSFMAYSNPELDLIHRYGIDYNKPYPEEKRVSKHKIVSYEIGEIIKKRIGSEIK